MILSLLCVSYRYGSGEADDSVFSSSVDGLMRRMHEGYNRRKQGEGDVKDKYSVVDPHTSRWQLS